ncbi:hypothetical protein ACIP6P_17935 [Streptomyces sp. NPDC088729]|uniref:hypothetical protein n=1 Tax=Streptomyces sp. NPDC088729 TaxID=3365876 RepID=UPI0038206C14
MFRIKSPSAAELAQHLSRGLAGTTERGLHLVEWLDYALVAEAADGGGLRLSSAHPTAPSTLAIPQAAAMPILATAEEISGLPDDEFFAVMRTYRTLLALRAARTAGRPPLA